MEFELVWFDSLGAKSSCTLVITPDVKILIDPGVAIMHPTFPAPDTLKFEWLEEGREAVRKASRKADVIVISHYHYDHFTDFEKEIYEGKLVLAKNPNEYINDSQRKRALEFYSRIWKFAGGIKFEKQKKRKFEDLAEELNSIRKDFGDYNRRRRELLSKGEDRFWRLCDLWTGEKWIDEIKTERLNIQFADGREFVFGGTKIRFTRPMFHGLEFDRLGWVVGLTVESGGEKLLYSSDVQGPIVEDYAEWIVVENPDIMIIDGPPTYQFGYMLTRTTLNRAIDNMVRILRDTDCKTIIWDHHLFRDVNWFERVKRVYEYADKHGINVMSAAEFYEKKPVALMARLLKRGEEVKREDFIIPPGVEV